MSQLFLVIHDGGFGEIDIVAVCDNIDRAQDIALDDPWKYFIESVQLNRKIQPGESSLGSIALQKCRYCGKEYPSDSFGEHIAEFHPIDCSVAQLKAFEHRTGGNHLPSQKDDDRLSVHIKRCNECEKFLRAIPCGQ